MYQAYNNTIANEAIENGKFGLNFKRDRMTWIKPSFLWMMYRSGWGLKWLKWQRWAIEQAMAH